MMLSAKSYQLKARRGFTLIEILIVVGIIGLLASVVLSGLGSVRGRGRDARRAADLRQVQQALELFYTRYQCYPGATTCGLSAVSSWSGLNSALVGATIGVTRIPNDPLNANGADDYKYYVGTSGQEYILEAVLEDANSPLLKESYGQHSEPPISVTSGAPNCSAPKHYCIKF